MFGTTNTKNCDKEKWVYSDFGISLARNVVSLSYDLSSSSCADNRKNNFLVLGECPTYGANGGFGLPDKKSHY